MPGPWNDPSYGTVADYQLFKKDESDQMEQSYKATDDQEGNLIQNCAIVATIWSTTDGQPDDQSLNDMYWAMKEKETLTIESGFRIWENTNSENIISSYGADPYIYTLHDFGIEKAIPIPEVEEIEETPQEDETNPCGEDGSACTLTLSEFGYMCAMLTTILLLVCVVALCNKVIMKDIEKPVSKTTRRDDIEIRKFPETQNEKYVE